MDFILILLFVVLASLLCVAGYIVGWVNGHNAGQIQAAEELEAGRSLGRSIVA